MKKFNRIFCFMITLAMITTFIAFKGSQVEASESCTSCNVSGPEVVSTSFTDEGDEVKMFEDGTEVIYYDDETIINDYNHLYDDYFDTSIQTRGVLTLIAKVIWATISTCSAIQYVTGHDACRIVLNYLGSKRKVNVRYVLSGIFIPGKIPGCEPSHSYDCNTGYWQYRVVTE